MSTFYVTVIDKNGIFGTITTEIYVFKNMESLEALKNQIMTDGFYVNGTSREKWISPSAILDIRLAKNWRGKIVEDKPDA